jgi:hypothetical protein
MHMKGITINNSKIHALKWKKSPKKINRLKVQDKRAETLRSNLLPKS